MKKLFTIILIFISITATAQTTDSLSYLYQQQRNLEKDLQAFNKQYNTGTTLIITGLSVSAIGFLISTMDKEVIGKNANYIIGAGALIGIIGTIVQIDAHKYLGGKASLTANGITIDLN